MNTGQINLKFAACLSNKWGPPLLDRSFEIRLKPSRKPSRIAAVDKK